MAPRSKGAFFIAKFQFLEGGDAYGGVNLMAKAGQSFSEGWLNFF